MVNYWIFSISHDQIFVFACCNFVYYISIIGCLFQVILSNLEPDESIPDDDEGVAVSLKKVKLSSSSSAFTDVSKVIL